MDLQERMQVNRCFPSVENDKKVARSPKLREASFDDHSQISALQGANGLQTKTSEEWRHLWVNNPAYIPLHASLPIGWVLEGADKQVVGYLGNIPLLYELEGQRLLACVAHAWAVDPRYRGYSLWLLEKYFSQKTVELFLNATVGPAAAESFAVFQSSPVPVGEWDHSAFWITNYRGFLASWLAMKAIPLARPLSYVLSIGPFLKDKLAKRHSRQCEIGAELDRCVELDFQFDVFWEALRKANPHVLLAVRTREMLEWHFRYALHTDRAWIVTARQDHVIIAYGIFFRHDNPKVDLQRIRLVDFQSLDGNTRLLVPMISWALERCRNEGIDVLETIGLGTNKRNAIHDIVPYKRKLPSWLYFYKTRDKSLAKLLSNPKAWDPSQFDGDASL